MTVKTVAVVSAGDMGHAVGAIGLDHLPGTGNGWGERHLAEVCSSTNFHRRMTHLTALQVLRLGAWSAVMLAHHKGRATTSEEPARPPGGSLFAATGGRRRRLTMSRHRRRAASTPEAAKRRSYVPPSYESEYSARAAWRCLSIGKGAQ